MSFFRVGDIIRHKDNGNKAYILKSTIKMDPQIGAECTYEAQWLHFTPPAGQGTYDHNDICNEWILDTPNPTKDDSGIALHPTPSKGIDFIEFSLQLDDIQKASCDHKNKKVYNSGFSMFEYCDDCGEEFK